MALDQRVYVWLCRAMYGYVGLCMAVYGCVWLCRAMYGYVGLCMAMYGYVWLCWNELTDFYDFGILNKEWSNFKKRLFIFLKV